MASEILATGGQTGATYYAWVWHQGQIYNTGTSAFESFNSAHWSQYTIAMTEAVPAGDFLGNMPVVAADLYTIEIHLQLGGSPAIGDISEGSIPITWNGTAEVNLSEALGTDGEVLVSTDTHTSGLTIQAVEEELGTVEVGSYATGMDPASQILATPARKLATDTSGGVLVGGYESGQDPGTYVLRYPSYKLLTNLNGYVIASNIPNTNVTIPSNLGGLPTPASNAPTNVPIAIIRDSGVTMQIALTMSGFPFNIDIGDIRILFRVLPSSMTGTTLEPIPPPPLLQKDNLSIGGIIIVDAVNGLVDLDILPTDVSDGTKFPEGAGQPYDLWVYAPSVGLASPAIVGTFTVNSL